MDSHTKSYKSPDPEVPIQSLYICINRAVRPFTQTVSLGCLCSEQLSEERMSSTAELSQLTALTTHLSDLLISSATLNRPKSVMTTLLVNSSMLFGSRNTFFDFRSVWTIFLEWR